MRYSLLISTSCFVLSTFIMMGTAPHALAIDSSHASTETAVSGECGPTAKSAANYAQRNAYVASNDKGEVYIDQRELYGVTNTEINAFIRSHLDDPAAIAAAMKEHKVDLNRIQQATGYSRQEMINYINTSNNADLKAALAHWETNPTTAGSDDVAHLTASETARNKIFNDPFYNGGGTGNLDVQRAIGVIHADLLAQTKTQYNAMNESQQIAWNNALKQRATQIANGLAKGFKAMNDPVEQEKLRVATERQMARQSATRETPAGWTEEQYTDYLYKKYKGCQQGYDRETCAAQGFVPGTPGYSGPDTRVQPDAKN